MFDTINVHFGDFSYTYGDLAEALLFYDHVNLVIRRECLSYFILNVGLNNIIELGNRGMRIVVPQDILCLHPCNDGFRIGTIPMEEVDMKHDFLASAIGWRNSHISNRELEKEIERFYFMCKMKQIKNADTINMMETIASPFLNKYLMKMLSSYNAEEVLVNKGFRYQFYYENGVLYLDSNHKSRRFNALDRKCDFRELLYPTSFLLKIASALSDLKFGAEQSATMMLPESASLVATIKVNDILDTYNRENENIKVVQKLVNPHYYSIAEAINSRKRSFGDLIKLLDKSAKFKEWKKCISDEKSFIEEYSAAVELENKWSENSAVKIGRWILTSGIGALSVVGPILGPLASGFDSFLVYKLLQKWSPNQFLKDEVRAFVS